MTVIRPEEKCRLLAEAPLLFSKAITSGLMTLPLPPARRRKEVVRPPRLTKDRVHRNKNTPKLYEPDLIVEVVAEFFQVTRAQMERKDKTGPVSLARNSAYKLLRDSGYSWKDSAKALRRKEAQTAMSGADCIEGYLLSDTGLASRFARLREALKAKASAQR